MMYTWRKCMRGASAIEFALLAPVYLLFLFGIVAYGIYFGTSHSLQQLASEAARYSVSGLDGDERRLRVNDYVHEQAAGYAFLDRSRLVVTATELPQDASRFSVRISYDSRHLPIWNLLPGLALPAPVIEKRSTIRIGGA